MEDVAALLIALMGGGAAADDLDEARRMTHAYKAVTSKAAVKITRHGVTRILLLLLLLLLRRANLAIVSNGYFIVCQHMYMK